MPKLLAHVLHFLTPASLANRLPDRLRGRLDYYRGEHETFYPWRGPMNGQAHRLEIARSIIEACRIDRLVETGTYRGTTTSWLSDFGLPVDTVEASARFHEFAKRRLADKRHVTLHFGSSRDLIDRLTQQPEIAKARCFFYLDAHWEDYLPLADEVSFILDRVPEAVILIDDFAVPGDPGYTFDDYGIGKALTLDYLDNVKERAFATFGPAASSRWETGAKRGCVVIAANPTFERVLGALPCLRPLARFPRG
jgi:hypothetical protein